MNKDELQAVIEAHGKWLRGEDGGERANLSDANLSSANLRYANLSSANLRYANLSSANLSSANLSSANLRYANLSDANLSDANLRYANLSSANLRYANLSDANLSSANLSSANLSWQSHQLLSEVLFRAAGRDTDKRKVAGLIRVSTDWCWDEFLKLGDPLSEWAKEELSKFLREDSPESVKKALAPLEAK